MDQLFVFMFYSFLQMLLDIQNGANPVTSRTSQYIQQNDGFAFPANSFIFVVYVGDSKGQYIENTPQMTYFTLQFIRQRLGTEYQVTAYPLQKCNSTVIQYLQSQGANIPYQQVQCLSDDVISQDGAIKLENSLYQQNVTKYQLQIFRCINNTRANYVCASNEEIDAKLQNGQVIFSYPLYEFNALNYTNPYQIKVGMRYIALNVQNLKVLNLVYKMSESYTQQNALYFFPTEKLDVGIEYYESYLDIFTGVQNGVIGVIQIHLDNMKFVYHRSYQNIFNIFGTLGGTFSVLKVLLMLILKPFQKLSFTTTMFNKISGKKKPLRMYDYFTSKIQRNIIKEQYSIIQQAIELESYMEMMLKFENNFLTFRSDKLVSAYPELFKSQKLQSEGIEIDRLQDNQIQGIDQQLDIIIQQHNFQDENKQKQISQSDDYVVNNER
ncbi:hypothetical protein pb186bvf_010888 [Paramecium bursaria]